jgi:hypothetical protein
MYRSDMCAFQRFYGVVQTPSSTSTQSASTQFAQRCRGGEGFIPFLMHQGGYYSCLVGFRNASAGLMRSNVDWLTK